MKRKIIGFFQDEENDWVARLECFHTQHVRHKPPFINRPWVISEEGRSTKIGHELSCLLCDHLELPKDISLKEKTAKYTSDSMPLQWAHPQFFSFDNWAVIQIIAGSAMLKSDREDMKDKLLVSGHSSPLVPGMAFQLMPVGDLSFRFEFYEYKEY